eukprot:EG_transcript_12447
MAACLVRPWPLLALRWFSTSCVTLPPHQLPYATDGLQRPPWVALATLATIAPPSVATSAANCGTPRRRRARGARCSTPSADVQALFDQYGVNGQKVVQRYPPIGNYDVQRVEQVMSYLAGLQVDVKSVVEKRPMTLAGRVEAYEAVVRLLRDNKVDIAQIVGCIPSVLSRRVTSLQLIFDAFSGSGHSAADVIRRHPFILQCSAASFSSTLQILQRRTSSISNSLPPKDPKGMLLHSLGLDADTLLRKAPDVLALTFHKIQTIVGYLERLGADVPKVLRSAPKVLSRRPEALQQRVQFLSDNGLDVLRHVNGCPNLFHLSVERKLQPTLTFVVEELGRSASDLDGATNLWTYDVEERLRPRFLFLKSLGKSPTSLSQFGSLSDQRFAATVAGTGLQQYYDWRRQNGYPVPLGTGPAPAAASGTGHASDDIQ